MIVKRGYKYSDLQKIKQKRKKKPARPSLFFRSVIRIASIPDLIATGFKYEKIGMEKLGRSEPCLILMNHSSFIDLKIASALLFPRKYNIITTSDGFIGLNFLMHHIGCIPTNKFVGDISIINDMMYAVRRHKSSILMFPEASYSFDGTPTPLPNSLGRAIKMMKLPVVIIKTDGAFIRDPLYNDRQRRRVKVSARMEYILSPDEIKQMKYFEINKLLDEHFAFDNFRRQKEMGVKVTEKFRADSLNRVLYKCPHCNAEGMTEGKGIHLTCRACGKVYEMLEDGSMRAASGETEFPHIPDWYKWERDCVRDEIVAGSYKLDIGVKICAMIDTKCIYDIGGGRLTHDSEGFHLVGEDGLDYIQRPLASYSLYADYYWYKLGDIICIGTNDILYYCFPEESAGDVVAKTRLATEELFKLNYNSKRIAPVQ